MVGIKAIMEPNVITSQHCSYLFYANRKFLLHSLPSVYNCVVSSYSSITPSPPALLTCVSQSAQSLHSPFLQNGKFLLLSLPSSLQLHHIANLDDRLF